MTREFRHYSCSPRLSRRSRRSAMTLVELMVSVAVLTLLMVAFGMILSTSQKVVTRSNALMQFNSAATAITQVIRQDVSEISKDGFLSVWRESNDPNYLKDHLVFTTIGTYISQTDPNIHANAARIDYGRTTTAITPNIPAKDDSILWRRVTLLAFDKSGADYDPNYLGESRSTLDINNRIAVGDPPAPGPFTRKPNSMVAQPKNPADLNALRCVLATGCTKLTVFWWDTNTNNWQPAETAPRSWISTSTWPAAIKINFTLSTRPDLSRNNPDRMDMDYEVICPIRQ